MAKPSSSIYKDYWDAATEGDILAAFYSKQLCLINPETVEAYALRSAMTMCWDLHLSNIVFVGDCQSVVQVVYGTRNSVDELNPILSDIRFMLQNAQGWSVSFAYREVNQVAHNLAKLAFSFDNDR